MMTLRRALFMGIAACALLTIGSLMMAQQQDRQFDPAQYQQQVMDRIKAQAGLADADWEALKPKVQAVMEKRLPTLSGMRGGRPGGGGGGGQAGGGQAGAGGRSGGFSAMFGPQMEELNALRDALSAEGGGSEADIKTKMDAFVEAYKKRQEELKKAQDELAAAVGDKVKVKAAMMINGLLPVS